ncbi:alpha/beta hydrolase [Sphingomonas flavalba]|uniref:alpha/beta hydrolase n=1 Tax=Sphingomonas flavalba TaxID=2559804 RepID=UPI0039E1CE11
MPPVSGKLLGAAIAVALATGGPAQPGSATAPAAPAADGTVVLDGTRVPPSRLLSPEGAAYLRHLIVDKPFAGGPGLSDIVGERAHQDRIMRGFLEPMRRRYAVHVEEQRIGGVVTDVVTPADGIAPENRDRVLINIHGGGFVTGGRTASLVESVPLAALMRIKVISIDYRMSPEYRFPAASEDVAAVYRAVLKQYDPARIALYGCSAGGMLTAQAIAWFRKEGLPRPAAIGVFCASLGKIAEGDSAVLAGPLTGARPAGGAEGAPRRPPGYMTGAGDDDPLAYPQQSAALLAAFPPTLFITGTRAFEFSAALNSHNRLTAAGVESRFHGWDGMFHGFFYNSEMPEAREAYAIMARFFDSHMAR